tara:strand:- start:2218 stop:2988 length:771 start_codon:yes stop_codon:yes gene_type:complete
MTYDNVYVCTYTKKELSQLYASDNPPPLKCQAKTIHNNSMCNNSPKSYIKNLNLWKCGIHSRTQQTPHVKNGLRQRQTTFNYATSVTLHNSNDLEDTSDPLYNELGDNMCFYCDSKMTKCSFDHIKPVVQNGTPSKYMITSNYNKVMCCYKCNPSKGGKDVVQWMITQQCNPDKIVKIEDRIQNIPQHSESFMEKVMIRKHYISSNSFKVLAELNEKPGNNEEDIVDACVKFVEICKSQLLSKEMQNSLLERINNL